MSAVTMAAVAAGAAAAGWAAASARQGPTHTPAPRRRVPRRAAVRASPPGPSGGGFDSLGSADSTVRQVSQLQKGENNFKAQLDSLKAAALDANAAAVAAAQQAASGSGRLPHGQAGDGGLRARLEGAVAAMQAGLIERDTEVRLLLLAALSGEHILYIGPPGTAKSELGRRLSRLCHGVYFERLLTRFSVPEELFGPLSMRALEEDKYIRQTSGYLPDATVAFVDEIFKANSAILNTLLTLLNERLFDNGSSRVHVPLLCLVGASNELPESEELDALYDRFLLRRRVQQVSQAGLLDMLGNGGGRKQAIALRSPGTQGLQSVDDPADQPLLTADDFNHTRERALDAVEVPPSVLQLIADLRTYLQDKCEPPVYVSDRRLVKAVALMQVAAYTSGRSRVSEYDCLLLRHILWQRPDEAERIYDWLLNNLASDDGLQQLQFILNGMFGRACKNLGNAEATAMLVSEVGDVRDTLVNKLAGVYSAMEGGFPAVTGNLWLGQDEAQAVASALLPKLEKSRKEVEDLLFEVVTLEVALANGAQALDLAQLLPQRWQQFLR
ncbi:ATPase associated with various cellular activities AAA_5 isoform A [Chlorella sorokiniana]|uniref:ATPase associated with various cellular activities AAA_5 isoform A n=1 Tax=Chlorella sorokiniana TaxID=3076 RepID=A0A2P6TRE6_CHLSO|nr:ATPase associated with various cellular activities AAA_5 isoform A [Chlorella sorokiniana]|eukprot:PRW56633.1 ATPase associated with various cellular activities AAA_5 isoform A [Chlorella sorokiniana]